MQCKFCEFTHAVEAVLLKHYKEEQSGFESIAPVVVHDYKFRTFGALKSHISQLHRTVPKQENISFQFWMGDFKDISKKKILIHLHHQFRQREIVFLYDSMIYEQ